MTLIDFLSSPWAITEAALEQLQEIYALHMRGDKIDIAGIEARLGRALANEQKAYSVEPGGVAVLPVQGVMSPRANMFMQVSGGISTSMLTKQLDAMHGDPRVKSALIAADSPGGNVLGVPAAIEALRGLAADKPTVLVGEGTVASAMYWLGSAANALFIEGTTDQVGSLGVVMRLGWQNPSTNSIELVRGKYKRASTDGKQVSPEALAQAEGHLDYLYSLLIDSVAQHRGVSSENVLSRMADGRVFIGQQAIDVGLVDGFSTVDAMAERLATNPAEFAQRRKAVFAPARSRKTTAQAEDGDASAGADLPPEEPVLLDGTTTSDPKGTFMSETQKPVITRASLEADHPAVFAQLRAEFTAAGAQAERDRIKGVREQSMPGQEALIEQMAADGKTTPAEAAMAVNAAQRQALAAAATAHAADAPKPAKGANAADDKAKTKDEQVAEAKAYAAEQKVDFITAMKKLGFSA
jgi:ClpP class serine protease